MLHEKDMNNLYILLILEGFGNPGFSCCYLELGEFVVFEFQPVTHINAKGQQGNGDFGDHAGVVVLNKGIVAADINDSTEHGYSSLGLRIAYQYTSAQFPSRSLA